MSFEKKVLENFVQKNYPNSTEEEKRVIINNYRQRIAGKLKGELTDILVIYKENSKGFFGINREGSKICKERRI
jgi:hypothetical protein